jgi:hypothetical protein
MVFTTLISALSFKPVINGAILLCALCLFKEIQLDLDSDLIYIISFNWVNVKYFDIVVQLLPAIFTIALPLMIQTLASRIKNYNDEGIWHVLIKQKEIYFQFYVMPVNIIILIIVSSFGLHIGKGAFLILIFVTFIIYKYMRFIMYLMKLSANIDNEIFNISIREINSEMDVKK